MSGALAALNVLAAILLTLVLMFFFVKDGRQMWGWIAGCSAATGRTPEELGERIWRVLTGYVHGIALVALIDALLIGGALLVIGVPLAMPLTVLTFLAAFLPVVGAVVDRARGGARRAGREGRLAPASSRLDPRRAAARRQRAAAAAGRARLNCTRSWCCSR